MLSQKIRSLKDLYRNYKLDKLKSRLREIKLKKMGVSNDLNIDEISKPDNPEGEFDLLDTKSPSNRDEKKPLSPSAKVPKKSKLPSIIRSKNVSSYFKQQLKREEASLIKQINELSSKVLPSQTLDGQHDPAAHLETKFKKKFRELIYLNLKNFGYWINAASFIVSYTFIVYVFFNLGSAATSSEKGIVNYLLPVYINR